MSDLSKWDAGYEDAPVNDFSELPAGTFQCMVSGCRLKQSQGGDDMIAWELTVLTPTDYANRKIFVNTVFTEKTLGIIKSQMTCFGFTGKISELSNPAVRESFINRGLEVKRSAGKPDDQGNPRFNTYFQKEIELTGNRVNIAPPPMDAAPF